jgi:hypothetical protein
VEKAVSPQDGEPVGCIHKAGSEGGQKGRCIKPRDKEATPAGYPRYQSIPEPSALRKTRWRPFRCNLAKNQHSALSRLSGLFRGEDDQRDSYVDSIRIKNLRIHAPSAFSPSAAAGDQSPPQTARAVRLRKKLDAGKGEGLGSGYD